MSINSKLEPLSLKTRIFEIDAQMQQASLQGRDVAIPNLEESHNRISQVYQNLQQEIGNLKLEINAQTNHSNQEQMFSLVATLTGYETDISKCMIQLNDQVLTRYPTAKIDYGRPCISEQKAPLVETKNPKFAELLQKSACIREIRGDGNCFLSAFTTRFLETLIKEKTIINFIQDLSDNDAINGILKESLIETLFTLNDNPTQLEQVLQNNQKILPFVNYFRHVAANEMKNDPEFYEAFLRSDIQDLYKGNVCDQSLENLIDQYVLTMGTCFSHPMITALCKQLQFPVIIIDPKMGAVEGLHILDQGEPKGTFCRNGEHYFVLYTKEEAPPMAPLPSAQLPLPPLVKPTEIAIQCQVPFGHNLFIRGSGNPLNWDKGIPLIQIDEQTWIFRSSVPLNDMEYKFLFDDEIWETGSNHKISQGRLDGAKPTLPIPPSANTQFDQLQNRPIQTTRITVKYDAGVGNKLTIQGTAPGLNWGKGIEMKNLGNNIWIWETQSDFEKFEFKILLNDKQYETGQNHTIECGKKNEIVPSF